mgnify:CR=1 FL=1
MKKRILLFALMTASLFGGFERIYGGYTVDKAFYILELPDGGFIVCGSQDSVLAVWGDAVVMRLDFTGDTVWTQEIYTPLDEKFYSVASASDNSFVLAGHVDSPVTEDSDLFLVKMGLDGSTIWEKRIGIANEDDWATKVRATSDGGYVIAGFTTSFSDGNLDMYMVKTDSEGDTIWTRHGGRNLDDVAYDILQTPDNGYIVTGITESDIMGIRDIFLLKTDELGDTIWSRTYGGSEHDEAYGVEMTDDGGYIIVGSTQSYGSGGFDVYIICTDEFGDTLWTRTYGSSFMEWASDIQKTDDGCYLIAGWSSAFSGLGHQIYLLKIDADGYLVWERNYGGTSNDVANAVIQTSDMGIAMCGFSYSYGAIAGDIFVVRTDSTGNVLAEEAWSAFPFSTGWNLISWPFTETALFADVMDHAIPPFYYFDEGSYEESDTIWPGKGIWTLSGMDTVIYRLGEDFSESVTIDIRRGWNMIGCTGHTLDLSVLTAHDEIILPIFSYNADSRDYEAADFLSPTRGYFVLATDSLTLTIGD